MYNDGRPRNVCYAFQNGNCRHEDNCRYDHWEDGVLVRRGKAPGAAAPAAAAADAAAGATPKKEKSPRRRKKGLGATPEKENKDADEDEDENMNVQEFLDKATPEGVDYGGLEGSGQ